MRRFLLLCASIAPVAAQTIPAGTMATDWDIRAILQEMSEFTVQLAPVLDQIDVGTWKGASETYAEQLQSSKDQSRAFGDGAKVLARKPDVLSKALELYFRLNALETMLGSLQEAVRRYQSP